LRVARPSPRSAAPRRTLLDDRADRGNELVGNARHGVAPVDLHLPFRIHLPRAQRFGLLHPVAELHEGAVEPADFGIAFVARHLGIETPGAELFQRIHRPLQGSGDGTAEQQREDQAEREACDQPAIQIARAKNSALTSSMEIPVVSTQPQCLSNALRNSFGVSFTVEPGRRPNENAEPFERRMRGRRLQIAVVIFARRLLWIEHVVAKVALRVGCILKMPSRSNTQK
jgi:hypothetical protein